MTTRTLLSRSGRTAGLLAALLLVATAPLLTAQERRTPELPPGCEALRVPAGHAVSAHAYATGVQTYRWDAANGVWMFTGPLALLHADPAGRSLIGIHYAGPTWLSNSGSGVVGRVAVACTVESTSIPWLLLSAVSSRGPGPFDGTTFIQRVNTTGGLAPAHPGLPNETVWVPYTAEYWFYRAR